MANKGWNWDLSCDLLPHHVESQLLPFLISSDRDSSDGFLWGLTSNVLFIVKSIYGLVTNSLNPLANRLWKLIWKLRPCLIVENFLFYVFKLFENKENMFSYENQTKTNFENKENEFIIFNILYMNQKTALCCFPCFRIK